MFKTTVQFNGLEFTFTDDDVIEMDWIDYEGDFHTGHTRLWLLHDHGFTLCVVQADNLQEALDKAVDEGKLDRFMINLDDDSERSDYMTTDASNIAAGFDPECPEYVGKDGTKWFWAVEPAFLGNASEPFDIDSLGYVELPLPKRSVTRLFGERVNALSCHV